MSTTMPKHTRLNLRISEEFRQQIEALAEYHGLTISSYAHSLLVKAIRKENEALNGVLAGTPKLMPSAGSITFTRDDEKASGKIKHG